MVESVVLDCRWLGISGAGRTTELVLRGLAEAPPPGRWCLWGPEKAIAPLAWPDAEIVSAADDPRMLLGQRHSFAVPRGDFYVFLHQQRPLRALPSATFVYDTIPLRYGSSRAVRELKRVFLRRVARISTQVLTISEYSKACIARDLDVPADRVEILPFPVDDAFIERIRRLRASAPPVEAALYVGAFLPHKNLPRLLAAFSETEFCRRGGRLRLAGATNAQARQLWDGLDGHRRQFVSVHPSCSQAELDALYATSLFVVQPSLEEGFGLPVWEALSCGMPVCVSDGGALPEVTRGFANPFPARSVPAMSAAIDDCARRARERGPDEALRQSLAFREQAPTIRDYGLRFQAVVARHARLTS